MAIRVLFFGDVVGAIGRRGVIATLPELKEAHHPDLIIANVENLAHGAGVTEKTLHELEDVGVQAFTGGNHSWGNPLGLPLFTNPEWKDRLVAPTNFGKTQGGSCSAMLTVNNERILLLNLTGKLFMHPDTRSPFSELDTLLTAADQDGIRVRILDFHAEATAEKEALAHYADGRLTALFGTHTHVPTADAKILPGGTGYVTDIGRCGAHDSVVGFEKISSIQRFLQPEKNKQQLLEHGPVEVNAILLEIDPKTGHATGVDRIRKIVDV